MSRLLDGKEILTAQGFTRQPLRHQHFTGVLLSLRAIGAQLC